MELPSKIIPIAIGSICSIIALVIIVSTREVTIESYQKIEPKIKIETITERKGEKINIYTDTIYIYKK